MTPLPHYDIIDVTGHVQEGRIQLSGTLNYKSMHINFVLFYNLNPSIQIEYIWDPESI